MFDKKRLFFIFLLLIGVIILILLSYSFIVGFSCEDDCEKGKCTCRGVMINYNCIGIKTYKCCIECIDNSEIIFLNRLKIINNNDLYYSKVGFVNENNNIYNSELKIKDCYNIINNEKINDNIINNLFSFILLNRKYEYAEWEVIIDTDKSNLSIGEYNCKIEIYNIDNNKVFKNKEFILEVFS
jgi:hypothetical protein